MNITLIKLFNAALPEETISFSRVNSIAMKLGYLVEPAACTQSVLDYLQTLEMNPNATFYKTFADVVSKTREELLFDQLLHYMTTYGTGFALGNGYVPNDGEVDIQTTFANYKVIKSITEEELAKRCYDMLVSGIALSTETMQAVADYIIGLAKDEPQYFNSIDIDEVKNREAVAYICKSLGIVPKDVFNLFRYIIYTTTGETMIIKNREMINAIMSSEEPFDFSVLSESDMVKLSSIFLRYKDLFLAFKTCSASSRPYINKLRKLAIKNHKPMKPGFWQNVFAEDHTIEELEEHLSEITPFKAVALMQTCMERFTGRPSDTNLYIVRNQKMFVRRNYTPATNEKRAMLVYTVLGKYLIDTLSKNSTKEIDQLAPSGAVIKTAVPKKIRLAAGVNVPLPSSEKSFLGNYPYGTAYKLDKSNFIGIYWKGEWGTQDYDLSFIDTDGHKVGWNSRYYDDDKSIIFSGDMTSANPEAAEVIYMTNAGQRGIIKVNQYYGSAPSKYQFFFGKTAEDPKAIFSKRRAYMVNPADIAIKVDVNHTNSEQQIAVIDSDKVVLMNILSGNRRVSGCLNANEIYELFARKINCFVQSEPLLRAAGFEVVDDSYEGEVDIDFTNLDKDSLISIMH